MTATTATSAAETTAEKPGEARRLRMGLSVKIALAFVGLVSLLLIASGAVSMWLTYDEAKRAAVRVQQEKAQAAAERIDGFVAEIEQQIGWTTHAQWSAGTLDQRRYDFVRLLRQVPAITELVEIDGAGKEQLKVSRLAMDVVAGGTDYSVDPRFAKAVADKVWFSPVYFRKESEPYMTIAAAHVGRKPGVTVAEVNLKFIWDVVTAIKIGAAGYAYVVDGHGRLIAHPDISLVLRDTDLSHFSQVAAALSARQSGASPASSVASAGGPEGGSVLSAYAAIPRLDWLVFVELPLTEAMAPVYASLLQTGGLLALGLLLAAISGTLLARRMVVPIQRLQAGAERLGSGELDHRIAIRTGDEIEILADRFNRMAGQIQESYATLESRVVERTRDLAEALDRQTATADVLKVISGSPGELKPVFDTMLENALRLCEAKFGCLSRFNETGSEVVAMRDVPPAFARWLQQPQPGPGGPVLERMAEAKHPVHVADLAAEQAYLDRLPARVAAVELGGVRTMLAVPMLKAGELIGAFSIYRAEVRPFSEKQIELVTSFANQAVIAIENARLLVELRTRNVDLAESLDRQTATSEVLRAISQSPSDTQPVFDAIAASAQRLCEGDFGVVFRYDGETAHLVASHGLEPGEFAPLKAAFPSKPVGLMAEALEQCTVVHAPDITTDPRSRLRHTVASAGGRAFVLVPMLREGSAIGFIMVLRRQPRPFTDAQIELLKTFADQAVIAIENARLISETREALEQQTATAEVLRVINASPGELKPVFDAMLENATRICRAEFGRLTLFDGQFFTTAAVRGATPEYAGFLDGDRNPLGSATALSRMATELKPVHKPDLLADPAYLAREPFAVAAVEMGGARSLIAVPLLRERTLIGGFTLFRQRVEAFTDKEIALVATFADQAVIAIENARLITETREALEQQTATAEVLRVINASPGDLAPVFDAILQKAHSLCAVAYGSLHLYRDGRFLAVAVHGIPQALADRLRQGFSPGPNHPSQRLLEGAPFVQVPDCSEIDDPIPRAAAELGGIRTALFIALRKDRTLLGQIVAARMEVRPFSEKEIALLESFAAQAVIAIENARLLGELRTRNADLAEALEFQTATAEVLRIVASSPDDLQPVFEGMLEKAMALCEARYGFLTLYDGEAYAMAASRNVPETLRNTLRAGPHRPSRHTALGRLTETKAPVLIEDVRSDIAYLERDPWRVAAVEEGGARAQLVVPLLKKGELIGAFIIYRQEPRRFADNQIALVTNFADQAVIAIENARLLGELRTRSAELARSVDELTATSDVLKIISRSTVDLDKVLNTLVETAARLCNADQAYMFRPRGDRYHMVASWGLWKELSEFISSHPFEPGRGTATARAALERQTIHIADVLQDPEYTYLEAQKIAGFRTVLGVPLLREDTLVGIFGLNRTRVEPYTGKQIELVSTFADQAVIAIENARLFEELRDRSAELARSVDELTTLREVGQAVSSTLDLATVLETIVARAVALAGAEAGAIYRYRKADRQFRLGTSYGFGKDLTARLRGVRIREEDTTALRRAIAEREPIQLPDLEAAPHLPLRDLMVSAGFRSVLIVPLIAADRIFGVLAIQKKAVGEFPESTIKLMQTFASQSVLAIQNARLFREIEEKGRQLQIASEHKSQFLANMSHELRTPLNAVLGYAELLADGIYGDLTDKARGVLERIQSNGKHLLGLINDVLDLSKIEAGQLTLAIDDYAMPAVVHSVVSATESLAKAKGLALATNVPKDLPLGSGDERRLTQVILNLVGNAIKFTDKGSVVIAVTCANGRFNLTVSDTGPGIAEADQARIFEEFQQVDNSNTRRKGGTGLGLSISKKIVEMHGGAISVESELGKGSTFHVVIPVRAAKERAVA